MYRRPCIGYRRYKRADTTVLEYSRYKCSLYSDMLPISAHSHHPAFRTHLSRAKFRPAPPEQGTHTSTSTPWAVLPSRGTRLYVCLDYSVLPTEIFGDIQAPKALITFWSKSGQICIIVSCSRSDRSCIDTDRKFNTSTVNRSCTTLLSR